MAFHPLGTAARRRARRRRRATSRARRRRTATSPTARAVPTALGVNPQLTIMALGHPASPPDTDGGAPHVVPDRSTLAVRDGRAYAARRPRARAGPRRRARRRDDGRLLRRERLAVPQPRLDAADLAGVPRRERPRLDAQLGRAARSTTRAPGPGTHAAQRGSVRDRTRCGCGSATATAGGADRAPGFPPSQPARATTSRFFLRAVTRPSRAAFWLRHTVHQRAGRAADGLALVHVLRRRRGPPRAARHRRRASCPPTATRDRRTRAAARRRQRPRWRARRSTRAGTLRCATTPSRCATSRASGCTARRCRARSSRARCPSATFDRHAAVGDREPRVDGWPGMVGHNWGAEHAERWIWLHGALRRRAGRVARPRRRPRRGRARCRRRGSPTARCSSTASATGSAGRDPRACTPRRRAAASSCPAPSSRRARRAGQTVAWPLRRPRRGRAPLAQLLDRRGDGAPRGPRGSRSAHGGVYESASHPAPTASSCSRSPTASRPGPRAHGRRPPRCSRGGTRTA